MTETQLCTLRDLAQRFRRFGLTSDWLRCEAEAGRIPCLKVGRRLLFDAAAVEAALLERTRQNDVHQIEASNRSELESTPGLTDAATGGEPRGE